MRGLGAPNRRLWPWLLVALAALVLLSGCRRQRQDGRRGVYSPPRNTLEAAYAWPGKRLDFVDQHGQRLMRLRARKAITKVMDQKLKPLGNVRVSKSNEIHASHLGGAPAYLLSPGRVEVPTDLDAIEKVDGFVIHRAVEPEAEPSAEDQDKDVIRRAPEAGQKIGFLAPLPKTDGGWLVLGHDGQRLLSVVPMAPDEAKPEDKEEPAEEEDEQADAQEVGDEGDDTQKAPQAKPDRRRWKATFYAPSTLQEESWILSAQLRSGQRKVEAHKPGEEQARLTVTSAKLSPRDLAPVLIRRFDPLLRAALVRAMNLPPSKDDADK